MKLAIPVGNNNEDAIMNERFGRSSYYAIYDDETNSFEFTKNPAFDARGGAGIQAVQFLISKGITAVVAPQLGPNADNALRSANIEVFQGEHLSAKQIAEKWKNNQLHRI